LNQTEEDVSLKTDSNDRIEDKGLKTPKIVKFSKSAYEKKIALKGIRKQPMKISYREITPWLTSAVAAKMDQFQ
jgi:hypothetical protein